MADVRENGGGADSEAMRDRFNRHKRRYRQLRRLWFMYPDVSSRLRLWIVTDEWISEDTRHYRRRKGGFDISV
jgi:hypothetical protein